MKKTLDIFSDVLQTISGVLFLFIFLINVAGIINRTFLDFSLLWVADVTTIAVAWMLALGMSVAVYKKVHITIDFVKNKIPQKGKKILEIITTLIMIAFLTALFFAGWRTTVMKMRIHFVVLYIPTAYAFMALPVFAFFSTIFMTYRLKNILLSKEE